MSEKPAPAPVHEPDDSLFAYCRSLTVEERLLLNDSVAAAALELRESFAPSKRAPLNDPASR